MIEDVVWAARHITGLLIRLTPKGIVFSFLCFEDMAASNRITRCGSLYISLTPKLTHHLTAYKCLPHMSNITYSNNILHTILLACAVKTQNILHTILLACAVKTQNNKHTCNQCNEEDILGPVQYAITSR